MRKWHGYIGYATDVETYPGVWEAQITEREYFGDVIKNRTNVQQQSAINATLTLTNNISMVADPYAHENFHAIRYVTYMGKKWTVSGIELEHPRIILTIGALYNG